MLEQERVALALVLQADRFERLVTSPANLVVGQAEVARAEGDFVLDRGGENLMVRILKNVRDCARRLRRTHLRAILAVDRHAPRRRLQQSDDVFRERRFAGTVLPDDRDKFARFDFEIDRIEHARSARIAEADVLDSDERGTIRRLGFSTIDDAANERCRDARICAHDRLVSLLDAFGLCVDLEQFECVT